MDDSPAALEAICAYVESDLFVVVETAADGCEALQRVRDCVPDLVVTDFQMPKLNGVEVTRALSGEFPRTPVVIVSLHDTPELRLLCQRAGAYAFVPKLQLRQQLPVILQAIHRTLTK